MSHPLEKIDGDPRVAKLVRLLEQSEPYPEPDLATMQDLLDDIATGVDGMLHVNITEGNRLILVSDNVRDMFGYEPDVGRRLGERIFEEIFHPDEIANMRDEVTFRQEHAELWTLPSNFYRVRHADGRWLWTSGHYRPLSLTKDGLVWHYLGLAIDMSGELIPYNLHNFAAHLLRLRTGQPSRLSQIESATC